MMATAIELLPEFIGIFVPLEIMRLEEVGGPKPHPEGSRLAAASAYWMNRLDAGELDELLFPVKGKTARSASMLVSIIACLAFETGGIRVFGHHFVAYETENPPKRA
jgi:hypothetical protein